MRGLLEEQSVAHSYGAVDGPTFKDDNAFGMDVALHARSSLDFNAFRYDDGADNAAAEYGVGRVDVAMNDARFPKQELCAPRTDPSTVPSTLITPLLSTSPITRMPGPMTDMLDSAFPESRRVLGRSADGLLKMAMMEG